MNSPWVHLKYVCMGIPLILNTCRDAIYRVSTNMRCTPPSPLSPSPPPLRVSASPRLRVSSPPPLFPLPLYVILLTFMNKINTSLSLTNHFFAL